MPDVILRDVKLLTAHDDVSNIQVEFDPDLISIKFSLNYEEYSQAVDYRFTTPEPIILQYDLKNDELVPKVFSGRDDFPRDIAHLNPEPEGAPASLCLWRQGGNSALYQQRGISEVVKTLQDWLVDASLSTLEHDGWEPYPRGGSIYLSCNIAGIQQLAIDAKNPRILKGESQNIYSNIGFVFGIGRLLPNWSRANSITKPLQEFTWDNVGGIPCFMVSSPESDSSRYPFTVKNIDDLEKYSENPSFIHLINSIKSQVDNKKTERGCIIIIAQRRPRPIISEIPGLSNDDNARHVDLTGFFVYREKTTEDTLVEVVRLQNPANTSLLASVSGIKVNNRSHIGVVGCGALGSTMVDQLARRGFDWFSLWDDDLLEAHNNARHLLNIGGFSVDGMFGGIKSIMLANHLKKINVDMEVEPYVAKFSLRSERARLLTIDHLIDVSGSDLEADWTSQPATPVTRVFISDGGRVGVLQTQSSSGLPDMLDLEAITYLSSVKNTKIKEWLGRQGSLANKMIGFGCSSATLEMPWSSIVNHGSALLPSLSRSVETPSAKIVLNFLDEEGSPTGKLDVYEESQDPFEMHSVSEVSGEPWKISLSKSVHDKIAGLRKQFLPSETAGFLLGLVNFESRRISIVFSSTGPCLEVGSTHVTLDSIDEDKEVSNIMEACNNMLLPLGTWHSHPGTNANPSSIDYSTLKEMAVPERSIPTVMLIMAEGNLKILVKYNRN